MKELIVSYMCAERSDWELAVFSLCLLVIFAAAVQVIQRHRQ